MKVKIEFEVNADFNKVMKCIYDRVDCLYYELLDIDSNFKDIDIEIRTHDNKINVDTPRINFHKPFPKEYPFTPSLVELYGDFCTKYNNGTCWGTKDKEKCTCGGLKKYCTFFDGFRNNQKGE